MYPFINHNQNDVISKMFWKNLHTLFYTLEYNILEKIDFVMLEWHYKGRERILSALQKAGFSYWFYDKNEKMGLVYAWNMNNWRR